MRVHTPVAELLFGEGDATPFNTDVATLKPWRLALACVESAHKCWLSTVGPDGGPHAAPVMVVLVDGAPCIASRPPSRKSRNLAGNPRAVITVSSDDLDLVVSGEAHQVSGDTALRRVAAAFATKYAWAFAIRDGRVYDESLPGSPQYAFYEVSPVRAFGYGTDGLTATRWRFSRT
ncbi:pyridoxamine 5'-phosphate oxidase family protein [Micromonospora sp. NPDC127501]|uniref:pyridoxamine 5'-phosphate oxidase family protein n=1 Tax=Micromonospora sp. NPDC127501 TaxID=3154872 RepID=UPI00331F358A